ncbi:conserved hypothetical protein [Burkholderia diffusa]|uniref:hypothetical protein n=1 Tax=Burkholderia diffusa TaxID=488732 RepID=UPI001CB4C2BC|nr:hypothetical protein [Burkholderia diffusa]CAG9264585.1 conserved hypothetical protein [Burkholderia diffusa]
MTAMVTGYPTEDELRARIERQLAWRGTTDTVALIWHGYLSGLMEWGLIELDVFDRLCALLPKVGRKELVELAMDEPIAPELDREIDESMRKDP